MKKVGILGGGQLGRMMLQAAANYPVETHVLENDATCGRKEKKSSRGIPRIL
jgi:5-(carboxyamino)imidazole ribonucleotide synthase